MRIDLPDHAGRRGDDEAAAAELPEPKAQGLTQVASESSAGGGLEQADTLNRLSKIVLAIVPALTVALAAVGSATGGLARLFRDQTGAARASIALVFLSFALPRWRRARRPLPASCGPPRVPAEPACGSHCCSPALRCSSSASRGRSTRRSASWVAVRHLWSPERSSRVRPETQSTLASWQPG